MAQQVRFFIRSAEVKDMVKTLDRFDPPNWTSLKAAMLSHWGKIDNARFTTQDLEDLVQGWKFKGGVALVVDFQDFRKTWQPIQSYFLRKDHINSVEEIKRLYYQSFSLGVQERIRDQLIKDKTMITTQDNRFKLPTFEILKNSVEEKDKDEKLVEQRGGSFFLPNGALIPVNSSRPIRHVVASYNPKNAAASVQEADFWTTCGSLDPWCPPSISSQSFAGVYKANPARKKHEPPKPFKAPAVPPSVVKRPARKAPAHKPESETEEMDAEAELFKRIPLGPIKKDAALKDEPSPESAVKPSSSPVPRVRFERSIAKDHPHAMEGMLKKVFDLPVPNVTVLELLAVAPSVAEGMKKWVSRRRVEVGADELKVASGTLMEDSEGEGRLETASLYSCPLGHMPCFLGDEEVYGIGNQVCELVHSGSTSPSIRPKFGRQFDGSPPASVDRSHAGLPSTVKRTAELGGTPANAQADNPLAKVRAHQPVRQHAVQPKPPYKSGQGRLPTVRPPFNHTPPAICRPNSQDSSRALSVLF
ncbi:hypothetical protein PTTG_06840 [Puccinia triticina 1-1 BBBD Race 1]|uniref:Uncharacterized protein n=1 Tax=Puccinia triticina (isolate 1-1 / race 1 (BBBD)) TaxID=630390 RepID=A0A180H342_PUCT1|nr:hypothetical protein PTTG_06840 [Puccinia triticina 1-1 BBBD Race 1]